MRGTTSKLGQRFLPLVLATGLSLLVNTKASAQSSFDPYRPESRNYNTSSFPTLPNNLALPGAARSAEEYLAPSGRTSRYNTFERFMNGDDDGVFGAERSGGSGRSDRRGGIGVPYYEAYRQNDRASQKPYVPNRESEKAFRDFEAERDRRYKLAMKEKNVVKRSKLLEDIAKMPLPRSSADRNADPNRMPKAKAAASGAAAGDRTRTAPAAAGIGATTGTKPGLSVSESMAAERLKNSSLGSVEHDGLLDSPATADPAGDSAARVRAPSTRGIDTRSNEARRRPNTTGTPARPPLPGERSSGRPAAR
jgi:hypothetical protein